MTVKEAASMFEVPVERVKTLLGKARSDLAVSDEELEVLSNSVAEDEDVVQDSPPKGVVPVAFISMNRKHQISIPFDEDGNAGNISKAAVRVEMLKFEDFRCVVGEGGVGYNAIMSLRGHGFMRLVHEPFKSIGSRTAFRKLLKDKVLTGINDEPATDSGLAFIHAWLKGNEKERATNILMHEGGYEALIEYVTTNKSYTHV